LGGEPECERLAVTTHKLPRKCTDRRHTRRGHRLCQRIGSLVRPDGLSKETGTWDLDGSNLLPAALTSLVKIRFDLLVVQRVRKYQDRRVVEW
jgi:hypothetical protein